MAIQFDCPQCQALIQVPETAGGKVGKCPQCSQKILVPKVSAATQENPAAPPVQDNPPAAVPPPVQPSIAPPTEPAFPGPAESEAPPVFATAPAEPEVPAFPGPPQPAPGEEAGFGNFNPAAAAAPTPMARRVKRRGRKKGGGMTVPLIFGALLVVGIVGYLWMNQKTLTGSLKGQTVKSKVIAPEYLSPSAAPNISRDLIRTVRDQLLEYPEYVRSQLLEIEFRGATGGVQMTLSEGPDTKLVRVSISGDPYLQEYYKDHAQQFDAPRQEEFKAAVEEFFKKWEETEGKIDYKEFRDKLALNAFLRGGLGFNVIASVKGKAYRCVAEGPGLLFFLVPKNTESFIIRPRDFKDGSNPLPEEFAYKVKVRG